MDVPRPVIDQDEIVSRAIHFCETQHTFSSSIVCGESQGAAVFYPVLAIGKSPFLFRAIIARCAFDDYLFRRERTGGLRFSCDSCTNAAWVVRRRLQRLDPRAG